MAAEGCCCLVPIDLQYDGMYYVLCYIYGWHISYVFILCYQLVLSASQCVTSSFCTTIPLRRHTWGRCKQDLPIIVINIELKYSWSWKKQMYWQTFNSSLFLNKPLNQIILAKGCICILHCVSDIKVYSNLILLSHKAWFKSSKVATCSHREPQFYFDTTHYGISIILLSSANT